MDVEGVDVWVIDGFNVLHACLLKGQSRAHWWTEKAQATLVAWLEPFAQKHTVTVVFDARSPASPRCAPDNFSARLCFAVDADDAIVEMVRTLKDSRVCVVTADRSLADRSRHAGASHLRPWHFASWLGALGT